MESPRDKIDDNLLEFSFECSIKSFKSSEEIESLTVDEKLSDVERAVFLLSGGQEVQRFSVISNLPDLLSKNNDECMRRIVPKVREVLHLAQTDMQLAACSAFLSILKRQLVPAQSYAQTFLQTILHSIDSGDQDVSTAWLETLIDVIDLLPKEIIKREVLPVAVAKGQLSQSIRSRLSACRILGKICTKFDPFLIKKEILPIVQSLCQDVEYEVRGTMCHQLDAVSRGLGLEQTKSAILPELVELAQDEEAYVRLNSLETIVNLLSLLNEDVHRSTIVPLISRFCTASLETQDPSMATIAKQLGKLCYHLSGVLKEEQKREFFSYYVQFASMRSDDSDEQCRTSSESLLFREDESTIDDNIPVLCRLNSAYNLPAMVIFVGVKQFSKELYPTFTSLVNDPSPQVRRTVALCFHEVTKLLGGSAVTTLMPDLCSLLRDESLPVLQALTAHLPETLESMAKGNGTMINESKMNSLAECVPAILTCEASMWASNNWRIQESILGKFHTLPRYLSSELIYQKFVPLFFRKLHTSHALPVQNAVHQALLNTLRHNKRRAQRQSICNRLVKEFAESDSCRQRYQFVAVCRRVLDAFSRRFFKQHFFTALLPLAADPVPNVRLRVCPLLPALKAQLVLPPDRHLLQALEQQVRRTLAAETDRDVTAAANKAVDELDKIQVQMESITRRLFLEEDLVDQKREEEENQLILQEERELKEEELHSAKSETRKENLRNSSSNKSIPKKAGSRLPMSTANRDKLSSCTNGSEKPASPSPGQKLQTGRENKLTNHKELKRSPSLNSPSPLIRKSSNPRSTLKSPTAAANSGNAFHGSSSTKTSVSSSSRKNSSSLSNPSMTSRSASGTTTLHNRDRRGSSGAVDTSRKSSGLPLPSSSVSTSSQRRVSIGSIPVASSRKKSLPK